MVTKALTVATAAGLLLVTVVAADATMNREYHLEARLDGNWVKVASFPDPYLRGAEPSFVAFDLNASDRIPFRVSAHNGYPWSLQEEATVTVSGVRVFQGTLAAPPFGDVQIGFDIAAADLMRERLGHPVEGFDGTGAGPGWGSSFMVQVGGETLHGRLAFREVAR